MAQQDTKWCRDVDVWVRFHCYEELCWDDSGVTIQTEDFGVPIDGSTDILCDNEAVYKNASTPESQLRKKHHIILYQMSREAVASGTCRTAKEDTETNLSDIFTKVLPRPRRELLLNSFTYWIGEPTVS